MSALHFERQDAGPSFVDLELIGEDSTWLSIQHGRLGTPGIERIQVLENAATAQLAFERQAFRLERKGFHVGHHEPSLFAAIEADPLAREKYLVYADWLLERQDPRGALITAMASDQDDVARALLDAHPTQLRPAWCTQNTMSVTWRLGFVTTVRFELLRDASLLTRLFRHPSMQLTQRLHVEKAEGWDLPSWERALSRRPPTLKEIVLQHAASQLLPLKNTVPGLHAWP